MKNLEQVFKMKRMLAFHARKMGHTYECELKVLGYQTAETRIENGKEYSYPETFSIKIENWNNCWFDFRPQDGRWISEGVDLNSAGLTTPQVYRRMLKQMKNHLKRIADINAALKAV